jgi:hypothetical protein
LQAVAGVLGLLAREFFRVDGTAGTGSLKQSLPGERIEAGLQSNRVMALGSFPNVLLKRQSPR